MIQRLFLFLCMALLWNPGVAGPSPHDWLKRMVGANEKLNYQGTLVHMCDGTMDVMHIVHRVDHGQVTERMTAQAAGGREIIRSADEVMCILPDQKKVMVEHSAVPDSPMASKTSNFPSFSNIDKSLYVVEGLGTDRIADRDTIKLAVRPADTFRYGYRLWLDRRTALPLKFELVDDTGQALEQGVFTEIKFYDSIAAQDVRPTIATDEFEWQRSSVRSNEARGDGEGTDAAAGGALRSKWRAVSLPPGFKLTFARSRLDAGAVTPMEQLVYSDGLATISVFIEAEVEPSAAVEGVSKIGATNAFTTFKDGYLITAMGGVPLGTARMVALSTALR